MNDGWGRFPGAERQGQEHGQGADHIQKQKKQENSKRTKRVASIGAPCRDEAYSEPSATCHLPPQAWVTFEMLEIDSGDLKNDSERYGIQVDGARVLTNLPCMALGESVWERLSPILGSSSPYLFGTSSPRPAGDARSNRSKRRMTRQRQRQHQNQHRLTSMRYCRPKWV